MNSERLLHYSNEPIKELVPNFYDNKQWQEIVRPKPVGLWISVGEAWKEWCISEDYCAENLKCEHEIFLRPDTNILFLESAEEIFKFNERFSIRDSDGEYNYRSLRWRSIKEAYQGLIISPYQWECRLHPDTPWYYGWDCASGCIWDITTIESIKLLENTEDYNGKKE